MTTSPRRGAGGAGLHAAIPRLLGTDCALLSSSSFGYGTTVAVETKDCADVLQNCGARVASYRAGRGAEQ